ncbi:putative pantothenate transporter [Xylariaceae sp. FL0016]|nr:putative pantothenate transporter [Xylariaceae sp. FL0016]
MTESHKNPIMTASSHAEGVGSKDVVNAFHYIRRGEDGPVEDEDPSSADLYFERRRALAALTADGERKLRYRIDWHLMPLCALLYMILGITLDEYSLITVLYTVPYILAEVPSNLLFKRMTPSRWQARIMFTWGIITACHAAITIISGLYVARFFLGLAEAGMFPGIILHMTYWYRPDKMLVRLIYLYGAGQVSSILSVLLAYAFDNVSGERRLSGWQWLFLVEGILTIVISRLWLFTLNWALFNTVVAGVTFYQSAIIADLGFTDVATAQLLNDPIAIAAIALIAVTGVIADRGRLPRPILPLCCVVVVIACYAVFIVYPNIGGVYAVTLLSNACTRAWFPLMWPWRAQTTSRATGSAFSIGFVNSYGQLGDAIGPQRFQDRYAPRYRASFWAASGLVAACALTMAYTWWVTRHTEGDTREIKRARREAGRRGEAVLEDVVDRDLRHAERAG